MKRGRIQGKERESSIQKGTEIEKETQRLVKPRVDNEALNELSGKIVGAAIEVHRHLGPGLLESAYESCLAVELNERGVEFKRQV